MQIVNLKFPENGSKWSYVQILFCQTECADCVMWLRALETEFLIENLKRCHLIYQKLIWRVS